MKLNKLSFAVSVDELLFGLGVLGSGALSCLISNFHKILLREHHGAIDEIELYFL